MYFRQSQAILQDQQQEIMRLKTLLDEANAKLWDMTPHKSIDEIAANVRHFIAD